MIPAKCTELVSALLANGWSFVLQHGKDTGDSPFISIEAKKHKDGKTIRTTWHTRQTGTYRLFSCMVNKHDVTLTKAMEVVREEAAA